MTMQNRLLAAALVIGLATLSTVQAQEKKIKREQLPPAVEKTVASVSKGATIQGFSTEIEDGKRLYEVELKIDGHGKDISMNEQGEIMEIEEEVAMDTLPAEVTAGLTQAADGGTISKVESLTKKGKLVAYEAVVKTGTKRREIQVGPDGKKLSRPE
jgi:hypothetical protein